MDCVVRIKARVIEDNTGIKSELPILLSKSGVLVPLLDYLLKKQQEGRSQTWMNRVVQSTQMLIEYMEANQKSFVNPKFLFQTFAKRLYTGTVDEDGNDPSGLYWIPPSIRTSNQLLNALTNFTDWLAATQSVEHMNPLIDADSYSERLHYAAWHRKNNHDFLGHIEDKFVTQTIRKARLVKGRKIPIRTDDDAISFPEKHFEKFYLNGLGGAEDQRVSLRDRLILILMHGAGVRISDALHLWVEDVLEDPERPEQALVRLYHPEDGKAPNHWSGRKGQKNRTAYLRERYALGPRNRLSGTQYVGWKTRVVDNADNYIQLHWFPSEFGTLFMRLWKDYLRYLVATERHHPYAFVSFWRKQTGNPLTINAFNHNYGVGLKRINLYPSKAEGFGPHGHRHSYGRRLAKAGVDPIIRKKALHHSSIESQAVYTAPSILEVSESLTKGSERLNKLAESKEVILPVNDWETLTQYGFEELDPCHIFTGKNKNEGGC
jgi:integrase